VQLIPAGETPIWQRTDNRGRSSAKVPEAPAIFRKSGIAYSGYSVFQLLHVASMLRWKRKRRISVTNTSSAHREVIDFVYYNERAIEEVAELLAIPKNTVKTRMFYVRKRLGELLAARD
jgi:hypothetical protein